MRLDSEQVDDPHSALLIQACHNDPTDSAEEPLRTSKHAEQQAVDTVHQWLLSSVA
jgi:hypothetical protein